MKKFADKVALVTGASGGIGAEIAIQLAAEGATVALHYGRNKSNAESALAKIKTAGGDGKIFQANVADVADIHQLFNEIDEAYGRFDILVNNAGISMQKPIVEVTEAEYDKLWEINTKGYFFCIQEAAKRLGEGGRIINIASGLAYSNRPGTSVYAASRSAIHNYTRVASMELGEKGITVNSVSPGPVSPGVFDSFGLPPEMKEMVKNLSPFKRIGTPDDIAGIVSFLASDEARWVSGQDILATGGARP